MNKLLVAGIGTGVGKTVVSAILTVMHNADYWKPVQTGPEDELDTTIMRRLIDTRRHKIHESAYTFAYPASPHYAAQLEGIQIEPHKIVPPETDNILVIEGIGGIFVPLTNSFLSFDLFKSWPHCRWVIVSQHYLGSINHTLLTINAMKESNLSIEGLIFNGEPNPSSEAAILQFSSLPILGRLLPEKIINHETIKRYATHWKIHSATRPPSHH